MVIVIAEARRQNESKGDRKLSVKKRRAVLPDVVLQKQVAKRENTDEK